MKTAIIRCSLIILLTMAPALGQKLSEQQVAEIGALILQEEGLTDRSSYGAFSFDPAKGEWSQMFVYPFLGGEVIIEIRDRDGAYRTIATGSDLSKKFRISPRVRRAIRAILREKQGRPIKSREGKRGHRRP